MDNDFISPFENDPIEPDLYNLSDGRTLEVQEHDMPGMAGEPTSYLVYLIDNKPINFSDIQLLLDPKDAAEIENWSNNLSDINHSNAIAWTI